MTEIDNILDEINARIIDIENECDNFITRRIESGKGNEIEKIDYYKNMGKKKGLKELLEYIKEYKDGQIC